MPEEILRINSTPTSIGELVFNFIPRSKSDYSEEEIKQLEKSSEELKEKYEECKSENDRLVAENDKTGKIGEKVVESSHILYNYSIKLDSVCRELVYKRGLILDYYNLFNIITDANDEPLRLKCYGILINYLENKENFNGGEEIPEEVKKLNLDDLKRKKEEIENKFNEYLKYEKLDDIKAEEANYFIKKCIFGDLINGNIIDLSTNRDNSTDSDNLTNSDDSTGNDNSEDSDNLTDSDNSTENDNSIYIKNIEDNVKKVGLKIAIICGNFELFKSLFKDDDIKKLILNDREFLFIILKEICKTNSEELLNLFIGDEDIKNKIINEGGDRDEAIITVFNQAGAANAYKTIKILLNDKGILDYILSSEKKINRVFNRDITCFGNDCLETAEVFLENEKIRQQMIEKDYIIKHFKVAVDRGYLRIAKEILRHDDIKKYLYESNNLLAKFGEALGNIGKSSDKIKKPRTNNELTGNQNEVEEPRTNNELTGNQNEVEEFLENNNFIKLIIKIENFVPEGIKEKMKQLLKPNLGQDEKKENINRIIEDLKKDFKERDNIIEKIIDYDIISQAFEEAVNQKDVNLINTLIEDDEDIIVKTVEFLISKGKKDSIVNIFKNEEIREKLIEKTLNNDENIKKYKDIISNCFGILCYKSQFDLIDKLFKNKKFMNLTCKKDRENVIFSSLAAHIGANKYKKEGYKLVELLFNNLDKEQRKDEINDYFFRLFDGLGDNFINNLFINPGIVEKLTHTGAIKYCFLNIRTTINEKSDIKYLNNTLNLENYLTEEDINFIGKSANFSYNSTLLCRIFANDSFDQEIIESLIGLGANFGKNSDIEYIFIKEEKDFSNIKKNFREFCKKSNINYNNDIENSLFGARLQTTESQTYYCIDYKKINKILEGIKEICNYKRLFYLSYSKYNFYLKERNELLHKKNDNKENYNKRMETMKGKASNYTFELRENCKVLLQKNINNINNFYEYYFNFFEKYKTESNDGCSDYDENILESYVEIEYKIKYLSEILKIKAKNNEEIKKLARIKEEKEKIEAKFFKREKENDKDNRKFLINCITVSDENFFKEFYENHKSDEKIKQILIRGFELACAFGNKSLIEQIVNNKKLKEFIINNDEEGNYLFLSFNSYNYDIFDILMNNTDIKEKIKTIIGEHTNPFAKCIDTDAVSFSIGSKPAITLFSDKEIVKNVIFETDNVLNRCLFAYAGRCFHKEALEVIFSKENLQSLNAKDRENKILTSCIYEGIAWENLNFLRIILQNDSIIEILKQKENNYLVLMLYELNYRMKNTDLGEKIEIILKTFEENKNGEIINGFKGICERGGFYGEYFINLINIKNVREVILNDENVLIEGFELACKSGQICIADHLFQNDETKHKILEGNDIEQLSNIFKIVCEKGYVDIVKELINAKKVKDEALIEGFKLACKSKQICIVDHLFRNDETKHKILKSNDMEQLSDIFKIVCENNYIFIVKELINIKKVKDEALIEGFKLACKSRQICIIDHLFQNEEIRCKILESNAEQLSDIFKIVCEKGYVDIVKELINIKKVREVILNDENALIEGFKLACKSGQICIVDHLFQNEEIRCKILESNAEQLSDIFVFACNKGCTDVIEELLIRNSKLENAKLIEGFKAICENKRFEILHKMINIQAIKQKIFNINNPSIFRETFKLACENGQFEIVRDLFNEIGFFYPENYGEAEYENIYIAYYNTRQVVEWNYLFNMFKTVCNNIFKNTSDTNYINIIKEFLNNSDGPLKEKYLNYLLTKNSNTTELIELLIEYSDFTYQNNDDCFTFKDTNEFNNVNENLKKLCSKYHISYNMGNFSYNSTYKKDLYELLKKIQSEEKKHHNKEYINEIYKYSEKKKQLMDNKFMEIHSKNKEIAKYDDIINNNIKLLLNNSDTIDDIYNVYDIYVNNNLNNIGGFQIVKCLLKSLYLKTENQEEKNKQEKIKKGLEKIVSFRIENNQIESEFYFLHYLLECIRGNNKSIIEDFYKNINRYKILPEEAKSEFDIKFLPQLFEYACFYGNLNIIENVLQHKELKERIINLDKDGYYLINTFSIYNDTTIFKKIIKDEDFRKKLIGINAKNKNNGPLYECFNHYPINSKEKVENLKILFLYDDVRKFLLGDCLFVDHIDFKSLETLKIIFNNPNVDIMNDKFIVKCFEKCFENKNFDAIFFMLNNSRIKERILRDNNSIVDRIFFLNLKYKKSSKFRNEHIKISKMLLEDKRTRTLIINSKLVVNTTLNNKIIEITENNETNNKSTNIVDGAKYIIFKQLSLYCRENYIKITIEELLQFCDLTTKNRMITKIAEICSYNIDLFEKLFKDKEIIDYLETNNDIELNRTIISIIIGEMRVRPIKDCSGVGKQILEIHKIKRSSSTEELKIRKNLFMEEILNNAVIREKFLNVDYELFLVNFCINDFYNNNIEEIKKFILSLLDNKELIGKFLQYFVINNDNNNYTELIELIIESGYSFSENNIKISKEMVDKIKNNFNKLYNSYIISDDKNKLFELKEVLDDNNNSYYTFQDLEKTNKKIEEIKTEIEIKNDIFEKAKELIMDNAKNPIKDIGDNGDSNNVNHDSNTPSSNPDTPVEIVENHADNGGDNGGNDNVNHDSNTLSPNSDTPIENDKNHADNGGDNGGNDNVNHDSNTLSPNSGTPIENNNSGDNGGNDNVNQDNNTSSLNSGTPVEIVENHADNSGDNGGNDNVNNNNINLIRDLARNSKRQVNIYSCKELINYYIPAIKNSKNENVFKEGFGGSTTINKNNIKIKFKRDGFLRQTLENNSEIDESILDILRKSLIIEYGEKWNEEKNSNKAELDTILLLFKKDPAVAFKKLVELEEDKKINIKKEGFLFNKKLSSEEKTKLKNSFEHTVKVRKKIFNITTLKKEVLDIEYNNDKIRESIENIVNNIADMGIRIIKCGKREKLITSEIKELSIDNIIKVLSSLKEKVNNVKEDEEKLKLLLNNIKNANSKINEIVEYSDKEDMIIALNHCIVKINGFIEQVDNNKVPLL